LHITVGEVARLAQDIVDSAIAVSFVVGCRDIVGIGTVGVILVGGTDETSRRILFHDIVIVGDVRLPSLITSAAVEYKLAFFLPSHGEASLNAHGDVAGNRREDKVLGRQ